MIIHHAKRLLLLSGVIALALFPLLSDSFYVQLIAKVMILAIFAMSLDLLIGYTGLVSLGHAAYFGLAGYAVALLTPQHEAASLWWTLPASVFCAALAALLIGFFVVRCKGVYFIMVTLAFAQMLYFIFHDTKLAGGSDGIFIYFLPEANIGSIRLFDFTDKAHFYYFVLLCLLAVYFFLRMLTNSSFGHVLLGIKVNEQRMQALGYSTPHYKLASFTIGGALAGLAGYLSAIQFGFVNPEIMSWHQSGNAIMMVLLGGVGNLYGSAIGAFAFVLLQEFFSSLTKHWQLLLGGFIVLFVLFAPEGISGLFRRITLSDDRSAAQR